jgi:hypothetical protein
MIDSATIPRGRRVSAFCTVINMNWTGEIMHGEFDGTYYVMEDGDCYLPKTIEQIQHDEGAICHVVFFDSDPRATTENE